MRGCWGERGDRPTEAGLFCEDDGFEREVKPEVDGEMSIFSSFAARSPEKAFEAGGARAVFLGILNPSQSTVGEAVNA